MKTYNSKTFSYKSFFLVEVLVFLYFCLYFSNILNSEVVSYIVFILYLVWRLLLVNILKSLWIIKASKSLISSSPEPKYKELISSKNNISSLVKLYEKNFAVTFYSTSHNINVTLPGKQCIPHSKLIYLKFYTNDNLPSEQDTKTYNILVKDNQVSKDDFKSFDGVMYTDKNSIFIEFKIRFREFYSLEYQLPYKILKILKLQDQKIILLGDLLAITYRLSNLDKNCFRKNYSI